MPQGFSYNSGKAMGNSVSANRRGSGNFVVKK